MGMNAFNISGLNQNALGGGIPVLLTGFAPSVTIGSIVWGTSLKLTDASTFPAGDSFGKINIEINDQSGGTVLAVITAASGMVNPSTATLNPADSLTIKVTVTSQNGCIADGLIDVTNGTSSSAVGNYAISFTTTHF